MAERVRPSFDQYIAKRGEPAALKKAREAYEKAASAVTSLQRSGAGEGPEFNKAREAKRAAGIAMHDARAAAEADYYAEEVDENVKVIKEARAAGVVKTPNAPGAGAGAGLTGPTA